MNDLFVYERLAWWLICVAVLLLGYWAGYKAGARDQSARDIRTVVGIEGSSITLSSSHCAGLKVGDKIEFRR